jgi:hypothetical protein
MPASGGLICIGWLPGEFSLLIGHRVKHDIVCPIVDDSLVERSNAIA